jgi:hypothetical protein
MVGKTISWHLWTMPYNAVHHSVSRSSAALSRGNYRRQNVHSQLPIWLWVGLKRDHLMLYVGNRLTECDNINELRKTAILNSHSTKRQINHGGLQVIIRHLSKSLFLAVLGQSNQTQQQQKEMKHWHQLSDLLSTLLNMVSLLFCTSSDYHHHLVVLVFYVDYY